MSGQQSIIHYQSDIADQQPPPPLPARSYQAEIIGASVRAAASSGVLYYNFQMRIPAEQYPADYTEGDPEGTVLYYNRLSAEDKPQARYAIRVFCEKVGAPLGRTIDCNAFIGLTANVEVNHNEYEGQMRANIARILSP